MMIMIRIKIFNLKIDRFITNTFYYFYIQIKIIYFLCFFN